MQTFFIEQIHGSQFRANLPLQFLLEAASYTIVITTVMLYIGNS